MPSLHLAWPPPAGAAIIILPLELAAGLAVIAAAGVGAAAVAGLLGAFMQVDM